MRKVLKHLICSVVVLSWVLFCNSTTFAFETEGLIPQIEILLPGANIMTSITQEDKFPLGFSQVLAVAIGHGAVTIRAVTTTMENEVLLFLTGVSVSSAGIVPFFNYASGNMLNLTETAEIGDENSPYGLLWIFSWMDVLSVEPSIEDPYEYSLNLVF